MALPRQCVPMSFLLPLKPYLTALVMPLCSLLLMVMACVLIARRMSAPARRPRRLLASALGLCITLWVLACKGTAIWLAAHALPPVEPVTAQTLRDRQVQAIVVLGGGASRSAPEYEGPMLTPEAMARLLYGLHLQRQTQLPMAYSSGVGWADSAASLSEAEVASATLARLGLPAMRWLEKESRDTQQNAQFTHALLKQAGIERIAVVTHAWHMPRALHEFTRAGFQTVVPAPMGYIRSEEDSLLLWIPSGGGLQSTQLVLREWLGLRVLALRP